MRSRGFFQFQFSCFSYTSNISVHLQIMLPPLTWQENQNEAQQTQFQNFTKNS